MFSAFLNEQVAKLADAIGLGPIAERRVGSSPSLLTRTRVNNFKLYAGETNRFFMKK